MPKRFTNCLTLLVAAALTSAPALAADSSGKGSPQPAVSCIGDGLATQVMLAKIATWLTENFDLSSTAELPCIQYVSATDMAIMRDKAVAGSEQSGAATHDARASGASELVAFYNDRSRTIYLSSQWTGHSAADMSVLIHEMVHHLQNASGMTFECAMGREKMAYQAQSKWLGLAGKNLEKEFGIDAATVLLRTSCDFH